MDSQSISGPGGAAVAAHAQIFGAEVIKKTLDYLNQGPGNGSQNADNDFQAKVLAAQGKGSTINISV